VKLPLTMGARPGRPQPQVFDPDTIAPRKIAPMVVWLCTDAASNVNGRSFHVSGDTISRLSEPLRERVIQRSGGQVQGLIAQLREKTGNSVPR